jgi:acetyl-CoA carboxylase biotin carboxyl carrier protein
VADDVSNETPGPFDVRTVKALVQMMDRHNLSEIDLRDGSKRICLRRGGGVPLIPPSVAPVPMAVAPVLAPAIPAAPRPAAAEPANARKGTEIKSPTVGTFYSRPKPEEPPYVSVGSRVSPTTVVCVIMAMKNQYEVTAECSGVITEILMKDEDFVEFGQPLFRVDAAG